ncbi:HEPN AbiU2-like domain-containing protein [Vibrio crassostreae]|nr:HEPN AbiU2-like domain-containing protein [Vibrio crassostreae]CAK2078401.1 HEPN AbiU2-like domain-containing protein [Vibrio crassostreae]CAK2079914.1 HEPN AbiU2-like domain-containing protein [Vibrio crassostreae]CAK2083019.1 HEPN AbiU2-like domain-containing protein [Vibrio crassostreae]CAK2085941.1 HEPN AbiU2-like domain-containing protein [Vibrio crassostreae]
MLDYIELNNIVVNAIDSFTKKGFFDYFSVILPSVITIIALLQSVYFYRKSVDHESRQLVAERELSRIYEAVDCFFKFSDISGLFFSLKKYEFIRKHNNESLEENFVKKIETTSNDVTNSFTDIERAIFILQSMGFLDLSQDVMRYKDSVVSFRSELISYQKKGTYGGVSMDEMQFAKIIETMAMSYKDAKSKILIEIYDCQESLLTKRFK